MKQKILATIKHPLISGSLIMFIGMGLSSVLNFLFNLFMVKNLTPADYGVLAILTSILSLAMVISTSAVPMIINFGADYFARKDLAHVRGLFMKSTLYYFLAGLVVLLIFFLFPQQIGGFFKIHQTQLLIICGVMIFVNFITTVSSSLLQANLSFKYLVFSNFTSTLCKLGFGILLYVMGFGVAGALWAITIGFGVSYLLSFYPLRFVFSRNLQTPKFHVSELIQYGIPAALASFAISSFISTDIFLVKHFFSPEAAGIYAGLSLIGRIIFFLTAPIISVMFPIITQKIARNESYDGTFLLSLLSVLLPSLAITVFYFLFPVFSIEFIVKKKEYLQVAGLVGLFGIFITIYSLLNTFVNFYLSIRKTIVWIPISIAAVLQAVLLWYYHQSYLEVIIISLAIVSVLLVILTGYYFQIRAISKDKIFPPKTLLTQVPE